MPTYNLSLRGGGPAKPKRAPTETTHGVLAKPDTRCAKDCTNQPRRHMLVCGHDVHTEQPEGCKFNCKPIENAQNMPTESGFKCLKATCGRIERERRGRSVFVGDKQKIAARRSSSVGAKHKQHDLEDRLSVPRSKTPANALSKPQVLVPKKQRDPRSTSRPPSKRQVDDEEEVKALNDEIAKDKALQALVASRAEGGVRMKSKLHPGYALKEERVTERDLATLHKSFAKLGELGTAKTPGGFRGQNLANDPTFAVPDVPFGERRNVNIEQMLTKKVKRKASTYLLRSPTSKHQKLTVTSGPFLTDDEEDDGLQPPRAVQDFWDRENSDDDDSKDDERQHQDQGIRADGSYYQDESHCVCNSPPDEDMLQCIDCEGYFHPVCLGIQPEGFKRCGNCARRQMLSTRKDRKSSAVDKTIFKKIRAEQKRVLQQRKDDMTEFDTIGRVKKRVVERKAGHIQQRNLKVAMKQIGAKLPANCAVQSQS